MLYLPHLVRASRQQKLKAVRFMASKPSVPFTTLGMPSLSPTAETGKIVKWNKKPGDKISEGDSIADIQTDKAVVSLDSTEEGYLAKILVTEESDFLKIGTPIGLVVTKEEDVEKVKDYSPEGGSGESEESQSKGESSQKEEKSQQSKKEPSKSKKETESQPKKEESSQKEEKPSQSKKPSPQKEGKSSAPKENVPLIFLPALSPSMETGKIDKWKKKEGDAISAGDEIASIETDKAVVSYDVTDDGFLAKILAEEGVSLKVGHPIAIVVTNKGDVEKYKDYTLDMVQSSGGKSSKQEETEQPEKTEKSSKEEEEFSEEPERPERTPLKTGKQATDGGSEGKPSKSGKQATDGSSRFVASPLAKKVAGEQGVDLSEISGTGPSGRIIKADVEDYMKSAKETKAAPAQEKSAAPKEAQAAKAAPSIADYVDIPNSNIRKITAERLTHSKQNIPHYYLTVDINMDKLIQWRTQLNDLAKGDFKLSVNDFVIKAAALALKAVPEVNSEWKGNAIRRYNNVHINVAVNTPKGLLTPIVKDADKLGLKTINKLVKEAGTRANEGKSTPDDLQIGTFTISNLGMFGISQFAAVINPPQACILAVGTTKKVVTVKEGKGEIDLTPEFVVSNMMSVTLSCDHRVVDGVLGSQWLQVFKDILENPLKFIL